MPPTPIHRGQKGLSQSLFALSKTERAFIIIILGLGIKKAHKNESIKQLLLNKHYADLFGEWNLNHMV